MAEFCSKCSGDHGFHTDINIKAEFEALKPGEMLPTLCEGCAMTAIGKTDDGKCVIYYSQFQPDPEKRSKWFFYDVDSNTVGEECKQLNKDE